MFSYIKKYVIFGVIGIIIVIFLIYNPNDKKEAKISHVDDEQTTIDESDTMFTEDDMIDDKESVLQKSIVVDVKGEVKHPGIYNVEEDDRVYDVIQLAGGYTDEAFRENINLAQHVHDEMVIIVQSIDNGGDTPREVQESTQSDKIRINSATQEEIETLSGIGPKKAQTIIAYREEHGYFETVEDLLNVSGIGQGTLSKIKDDIQIP